jgi:hypothetical protein
MGKAGRRIGTALALMALLAASCSTGSLSSTSSSGTAPSTTSSSDIPSGTGPAPYVASFPDSTLANCGPGSVPETGLQGQVPAALRQAGFKGFSCNMQLQSQYAGQGATYVGTWYGHCFYMPTRPGVNATNKGVAVVDVSDPTNIKYTGSLATAGMLYTHEGLRATSNGLLVAMQTTRPDAPGLTGNWLDVYDISKDCAHPVLKSSGQIGPPNSGHEGQVSPDGKTYYVGTLQTSSPHIDLLAIDISKPTNPQLLTSWTSPIQDGPSPHTTLYAVHGLGISADGKIGYLVNADLAANENANGLIIVDLSQVQERKPNPQITIISTLFYHDSTIGQMAEEFKLAGHPNRTYIIMTDEGGSGSYDAQSGKYVPAPVWPGTCDGHSAFSFGRIVDVTDPRVPTDIAHLKTQVQDPKNCAAIINDAKPGTIFGYNAHYCGVDNPQNATAIACGYFESGVRVFDIRDPYKPKEIAYYNPPANPANSGVALVGSFDSDPPVDWASSWSEFYHAPDGSWDLIIQTQENGVQVLKFANGAYPLKALAAPAAAGTSSGTTPAGWIGLIALLLELIFLGGFVLRRQRAMG